MKNLRLKATDCVYEIQIFIVDFGNYICHIAVNVSYQHAKNWRLVDVADIVKDMSTPSSGSTIIRLADISIDARTSALNITLASSPAPSGVVSTKSNL